MEVSPVKRVHVSIAVTDIEASVRFYTSLFGAAPSVRKDDYAKWLLDEPSVNFSLNAGCGEAGVSHLGIQVDSEDELGTVSGRLDAAGVHFKLRLGARVWPLV